MLKRIISLLLALTMLAGYMPPMHVFAEEMVNAEYDATEETVAETEPFVEFTEVIAETVAEPTQPETVPEETAAPTEETVAPTEEPEEILQVEEFVYTSEADYTSEELYEAYAASLFFGNSFSFFGTAAGEMLTGDEKTLYDALVPFIKQVACGQRESASISIGQALTGYPVDVEATFTGSGFTGTQLGRVIDALMADLPFEFYWYEKTSGCSASRITTGSSLLQIILSFSVADNYNTGDPFTADIAKTGTAAQSVARAKDIVNTYASKSDYEKLVGYKEEICDLVDYNWDAAWDNVFSTDIDPWQLIYVFDGNPETRVVCEGYSKAFQYLCDLTDFKGDVTCYAVTGYMDGGGHMWNIVSIKDVNYFADVTNSDSDSIGYDGRLFLAGASGSVATGYIIGGIQYVYDEDTKILWGAGEDSILNLSSVKYTPPAPGEEEDEPLASGTCGENLTWTLDDAGTLTISGTGAMEDADSSNTMPWYGNREYIKSVVIENGATGIGEYAFSGCSSLESIEIPDSVTRIGSFAFYGCNSLTKIHITDIAAWLNIATESAFSTPLGANTLEKSLYLGGELVTNVIVPEGVTSIGYDAFYNCSSLVSIELPDSVTSISSSAFYNCSNLMSIELPDSVTRMDDCVFFGCSSLTSIDIPDGVTRIGYSAFERCTSLTNIKLPDTVSIIASDAFSGCTSLTSIELPDSVTIIGSNVFSGCTSLQSIVFEGNAPAEIYPDAFADVETTAYYPVGNPTWTTDMMQNYGGTITWVPMTADGHAGGTATCKDQAICDICGLPYGELDKTNHVGGIEIRDAKTATCIEAGYTGDTYCLSCNTMIDSGNTTEITSHSRDEKHKCTICGHIGGTCGENLTWELDDAGTLTISGTGEMDDYYAHTDPPVAPWDAYKDQIVSVVIGEGVTETGAYAFGQCFNLTSVTLPSSLLVLGQGTFWQCSQLTEIALPSNLQRIEHEVFLHCGALTSIVIPASVTEIVDRAFGNNQNLSGIWVEADNTAYCNDSKGVLFTKDMTKLVAAPASLRGAYVVPSSVTAIGWGAFVGCYGLTSITLPSGLTEIGNNMFFNCSGLTTIEIPVGVNAIGSGAFWGCSNLTSIKIPASVTSIEQYAFYRCDNLKDIYYSGNATQWAAITIGEENEALSNATVHYAIGGTCGENLTWTLDDAGTLTISGTGAMDDYTIDFNPNMPWYEYRDQITSIEICDGVTSIGTVAFNGCSNLRNVMISDSVTRIGMMAFSHCYALTEVNIPAFVTRIEEGAFMHCTALTAIHVDSANTAYCNDSYGVLFNKNKTVLVEAPGSLCGTYEIPASVTSIGSNAFRSCTKLTNVQIPNSVTQICESAFLACSSLVSVEIPSSVTEIAMQTFTDCSSLTSVTIPSSVTRIDNYAFAGTGLRSIEIPVSVTEIGYSAFGWCTNLTDVYYSGNAAQWAAITIGKENESLTGATLHCAIGGTCGENLTWTFQEATGKLTISGTGAMDDYYVVNDPPVAPWDAYKDQIVSVVIGEGVTDTGAYAFGQCFNLTSVTLPSSLLVLGHATFWQCSQLTEIALPSNLQRIEHEVFLHCGALTSIVIPASVTEIVDRAFGNNQNLSGIWVEAGNTAYCNDSNGVLFTKDMTKLVAAPASLRGAYVVPASVTAIGWGAFDGCYGLTSITLPSGLAEIGNQTFFNCSGLTTIEIPAGVISIGMSAFYNCSNLVSIEIPASVTSIDEYAFFGCTGLKDVYYGGDAAQWQAITIGSNNEPILYTAIHYNCTNADHHWVAGSVEATCTQDGYTYESCACGYMRNLVITGYAPGHKEVIDKGFAPDCTNSGLTEGSHCAVCGEICVAQEVVPALGHAYEVQNGEIVCAVCGETVTIHIHQDYVALDIYENPQVQLYADIAPANLTADLSWSAEGNDGILQFDQNGLITALRAGTAYVVAELTVDGYTISSRCRVDVTENVQILGVQLSTNKVTTELYKDEYATFEILLDLPQNYPFVGDALMVTDNAAMAASGLNKSNLIKSVQFKNISDLFVLELLDDRTVQIVPTEKAMKEGVKGTPSDTVVVTLRNGQILETTEKLSLTVKKTQPKLKATIASFNSFYEGQSQKIVITGADVTGIRKNENEETPIPTWLELEDGCLKLNGNTPKASDKAYLLVDVDGWVDPVELTLTVKHAKKVPGIKLAATTVAVADRNASTEVELKLLCTSKTDVLKDLNITGITAPKGYSVENFNAEDGTFTLKKDGGFTSGKITLTVAYGSATKDLTLNVKTQAVKLKLSSSKVSLNKELKDVATVAVNCQTMGYDLENPYLDYDKSKLDVQYQNNNLIVTLKDAAVEGKTYPVTISAYEGAPTVKLSVAVLKKDSEVKSTIKATGTLDVIREGTAITIKPTYANYLNVNVDEDAVLKIYSSKDSFKTAIAEVYAESGIFTIDSSIIGNHTLKYKAQLETKIPGKTDPIKSNQISLSVKMGAAKLTTVSSGTTLFAKDRNDRALVWFEATDATLNDVASVKIKDAKYKDVFEIIDYRDGSFAIAFKDGKLHESIAKQLEKKSSVSITLSLDVFMEGNESAKANTTQKVKLTIVK